MQFAHGMAESVPKRAFWSVQSPNQFRGRHGAGLRQTGRLK